MCHKCESSPTSLRHRRECGSGAGIRRRNHPHPTPFGRKQAPRPFLYREFPSYGGQQTIRVGDWKAVRQKMARADSLKNVKTELYNIAADIGEQNDVSAQHPDIVAKLEKMMAEHRVPSEVFPLLPIDPPPKRKPARKKK